MDTGKFQEFDYGDNMKYYGQKEPQFLDISQIDGVPIALFVADTDKFASLKDSRWLRDKLKSVLVFYKEYQASHTSFQLGNDMSYFEQVLRLISEYT